MTCEIDGRMMPVERPDSSDELQQLVRNAVARDQAIYPVGGRTQLDLGLPPARDGIALDTTRLDRVIDYPSRDMTITVQAGIRIGKLREILDAEGQQLPVDVPRAAEATLGGAIATNTSGPRRYGFGTLRDYVIGISVVNADGEESKAGGRVVKNVAGYDLCKLYTGSLGTLGIIHQVTLKLRPLPEVSSLVSLQYADLDGARAALECLAASQTRPVAIELLNPVASGAVSTAMAALDFPAEAGFKLPWVVIVGFEDSREAVRWQEDRLVQETGRTHAWTGIFSDDRAERLWNILVQGVAMDGATVVFIANIRSSAVAEFAAEVARQPVPWAMQFHAGNGIAWGSWSAGPSPLERAEVQSSLANLRSLAVSMRGNLVLRRCPVEWKSENQVWGEPRSDLWLMRAIKAKLDPHQRLNPGRFI